MFSMVRVKFSLTRYENSRHRCTFLQYDSLQTTGVGNLTTVSALGIASGTVRFHPDVQYLGASKNSSPSNNISDGSLLMGIGQFASSLAIYEDS